MDKNADDTGQWRDVTKLFLSSIEKLNTGELLKSEGLTLSDAMIAFEVMDPKMDSGLIIRNANRKILGLKQSIEEGSIKAIDLTISELIGIIDESYACLATWLEGHHPAQTIMTNVYFQDQILEEKLIKDHCLSVFSNTFLKIAFYLDRLIHMVFTMDEEDFFLNNGKFNLAWHLEDQAVLSSIDNLCKFYEKLLHIKKDNLDASVTIIDSRSKITSAHLKEYSTCPIQHLEVELPLCESDKSHIEALLARLRFTKNFYSCFLALDKNVMCRLDSQDEAEITKATQAINTIINSCDKQLTVCQESMAKWKSTLDLGLKPVKPTTSVSITNTTECQPPLLMMGFEPLLNHKLLPPCYPRSPKIISRPETIDYLSDLITKLRQCISISSIFSQKSYRKSQMQIENFSRYFKPSSCVVSRSFIQTLYIPLRSVKLMKEEMIQSISEYCEAAVDMMKSDSTIWTALDEFLTECCQPFSEAINISGHNLASQCDRLAGLVATFKNLQYLAVPANYTLKNGIVYSWVTYHLDRLSIKHVLYSLEMGLFSYHEYPYVFWYLSMILYNNERKQIEEAKKYLLECEQAESVANNQVSRQATSNRTKRGGPSGAKGKSRKRKQYATLFHNELLSRNDAFKLLTEGLFLLSHGLRLQGKIKVPLMQYTSEEICFDHRFEAMTGSQWWPFYKQASSAIVKLDPMYKRSSECFLGAKRLFEQLDEPSDEPCLKVCKINMIIAKALAADSNSMQDRQVQFCFDVHPSFPSVRILHCVEKPMS